ncbi:MAG: DMT family transporter [Myxococcota bacterium]|nr:DMT family transporter [Myxococcota bacterium]
MLVVLLSLAAAFLFALGSAIQQSAAMQEHEGTALRLRLLANLLRRPRWLFGQVLDLLGFGLQATALAFGELSVVQPILVTTLVFALPIGARVSGQSAGSRELRAAVAVAAGLALYLFAARPQPGSGVPLASDWLVAGGITALSCVAIGALGLRSRGTRRAALLGAGAGILFGLASAFTKMLVSLPSFHPLAVAVTPWPWVLAVAGIGGMVFAQSAFQAGALGPAIAALVVVEPLSAAAVGVSVFGEQIRMGPFALPGAVVGIGLTGFGILELVRHSRAIRVIDE